jgi:hypothetical protein
MDPIALDRVDRAHAHRSSVDTDEALLYVFIFFR